MVKKKSDPRIAKDGLKQAALQQKIVDLENKWKRALADYANLEKRIEREKESFVKFSNQGLISNLIIILDDLERCQVHLKDQGLALTINHFEELLKSEGIEEIVALNHHFDPLLMEATELIKGDKGKVLAVDLKGYLLNSKVIRPAKVKVGNG